MSSRVRASRWLGLQERERDGYVNEFEGFEAERTCCTYEITFNDEQTRFTLSSCPGTQSSCYVPLLVSRWKGLNSRRTRTGIGSHTNADVFHPSSFTSPMISNARRGAHTK